MKKSQWATPTGIDRDYNYLKGIERTVRDANQDASERGIGVEHPKSKVTLRAWRPDSSLQQYLSANHITVQRAPKGMTRQKENHTRATKSGNVVWTVEWADEDDRSLQHDCLASQSLAEHYNLLQVQSRNAEKRRLRLEGPELSQRGSKRRGKNVKQTGEHTGFVASQSEGHPPQCIKVEGDPPLDDANPHDLDGAHVGESVDGVAQLDERSDPSESSLYHLEDREASSLAASKRIGSQDGTSQPSPSVKSEHHYYMLKASTRGLSRVLIPLDANCSLTTALRDQVVQEYPTIFVLEHPPDNLPDGFALEAEYLKTQREIRSTSSNAAIKQELNNDDMSSAKNAGEQPTRELDASSILEMLQRDITR